MRDTVIWLGFGVACVIATFWKSSANIALAGLICLGVSAILRAIENAGSKGKHP